MWVFLNSLSAFCAPKHTVPPGPFSARAPFTSAAALALLHLLLQGCTRHRRKVIWQQRHPQKVVEANPTSLRRLHIYLLIIQQSPKGTQAVEQPEGWNILTKPYELSLRLVLESSEFNLRGMDTFKLCNHRAGDNLPKFCISLQRSI